MSAAPITIRPAFAFTRHAVDRFVKRVWPTIGRGRPCADDREALTILGGAAHTCDPAPRRTHAGADMWSIQDPPMRWITRDDVDRRTGRPVAVVVTVLSGADDAAAEEEAEREVVEAHRRLSAVPELGREEATSPVCAGYKPPAVWVQLEMQRLAVEKARLSAMNTRADRERAAEYARQKTARHVASQAHEALFRELLARLAEVDPEGSSELLERARARVAKWEAEGRLNAREEEHVNVQDG